MILENMIAAEKTQPAMGTVMTHRAFGPHAHEALDAACREVDRLEGLFSRFLPASEVSRVNRSAGMRSEAVSVDTYKVLASALEFSRISPGCFDVTIEPLVAVWQAARESLSHPAEAAVRRALALVNFEDLTLDPWEMTAGLRHAGQSIDLGGIGKGYAADRVRDVLSEHGVFSACANLGGNVVTLGAKPDGSPWRVGIQHPRHPDLLVGAVSVSGQSVVTSGDYQRFYIDRQGRRCHHILNPASGYPAESGLCGVTVIAESALEADALSTILFAAGIEQGWLLLRGYPQAEAVFIDSNTRVFITPGLQNSFQAAEGIEPTIYDGKENETCGAG